MKSQQNTLQIKGWSGNGGWRPSQCDDNERRRRLTTDLWGRRGRRGGSQGEGGLGQIFAPLGGNKSSFICFHLFRSDIISLIFGGHIWTRLVCCRVAACGFHLTRVRLQFVHVVVVVAGSNKKSKIKLLIYCSPFYGRTRADLVLCSLCLVQKKKERAKTKQRKTKMTWLSFLWCRIQRRPPNQPCTPPLDAGPRLANYS